MISNFIDIDDWRISFELLYLLQDRWGKLDVDWSASSYNAKLPDFFSRFWNEGSTGVDAFTENWGEAFGLFVPPVILVPRVLQQIKEQRTRGVLVIPLLALRAFWALLCMGQKGFTKQITDKMDLSISKDFYTPSTCGRGVLVQKTFFFCYGGIESELSRFMKASCVRITFQLGQCCQDHIFVYVDNYKRCYLIMFCY